MLAGPAATMLRQESQQLAGALVLFRIFEHGAPRRLPSSKAQSKPKPAKSEKVPEYAKKFRL
jgi:hypothetical protein